VGEEAGIQGEVVFDDDALSSSSSDADDGSENDVGLNPLPENVPGIASDPAKSVSTHSTTSASGDVVSVSKVPEGKTPRPAAPVTAAASGSTRHVPVPSKSSSRLHLPHDRPVILLPNGLVIYDKVSFSVAMHHAMIRGTYTENSGHVQLVCKGVVIEAIWPKISIVSWLFEKLLFRTETGGR
jgi:hypothetical protein